MQISRTKIPDVLVVEPKKFEDPRGFFSEVYKDGIFDEFGFEDRFIQDNHAFSVDKGVLRGLHFQSPPFAQDKLVRVTRGAIWDVVVDVRHGSPTYGQWVGEELSEENWKQIFVPKGFAHGYVTLRENTEVLYKVTNRYAPEHDHGIMWDDASIGVDWKLGDIEPILSEKDKKHPTLDQSEKFFEYNR